MRNSIVKYQLFELARKKSIEKKRVQDIDKIKTKQEQRDDLLLRFKAYKAHFNTSEYLIKFLYCYFMLVFFIGKISFSFMISTFLILIFAHFSLSRWFYKFYFNKQTNDHNEMSEFRKLNKKDENKIVHTCFVMLMSMIIVKVVEPYIRSFVNLTSSSKELKEGVKIIISCFIDSLQVMLNAM